MYDSPAPAHHFHLQYQLLPPSGGAGEGVRDEEGGGRGDRVSRSDVVTFGVVSKVYTEQGACVVRCWEEEEEEEEDDDEEEKETGEEVAEEEGEAEKPKKKTHFGWRHK